MPTKSMPKYWQTFLIALGMAALLFLPFIVYDGGYFTYYGDFNVQQIPFYKLAHEAVRSGNVLWSFYTDLGASFLGSYSFYLLFSPFFWLTLPFPTTWIPFLMGPLLVLKTACAALTAYLFLERFVRDRVWAIIGSLLYAFSGWMFFNIFFNHFHEPAIFFPLLLLGVEKLVYENKKGFFALMVAVNAVVNYWFFVGEAVFTVLYFLIRLTDPGWRMSVRKFIRLTLEALLGVALSAVVLVPSVMALAGNPRTGLSELLTGWNLWLYWQPQNTPAVVQSLFFPPELPARLNFFPDSGGNWASRSAWLPLFGMSGVIAYFFQRKNDWLKKILALCLAFALVPGLNSLFILLNHSYYARWFYMPILLMCLATIRALEDSAQTTAHMLRSLKWCMCLTIFFVVMCGLTPQFKEGELVFGLENYPAMLWVYAATALACILLVTIFIVRLRESDRFPRYCGAALALASIIFGIYYMGNGKNNFERSRFVINTAIEGRELLVLEEEPFARIDTLDALDNLGMFWHRPTIQAFHSIVPPSIMEFYPEVGVKRDVGSRPETEYYALRPLLSVRWLFILRDSEDQEPMPGYEFHSEQLGFNVYENTNYLPMGFGYTAGISREEFEKVSVRQRASLMLHAIVLEDEAAMERNSDILETCDSETALRMSYGALEENVRDRREQAASYFGHDNRGFTARCDLDADTLLFFSVPYEKGWSATVNGQPAVIEKVNIGFMAVRVPAGPCEIRFDYFPPGLKIGAAITAFSLMILLAYLLTGHLRGGKQEKMTLNIQRALFLGETVNLTWEEYMLRYHDRQQRRQALQRTLNEASALHIQPKLDEVEQTLRFKLDEDEEQPEQ